MTEEFLPRNINTGDANLIVTPLAAATTVVPSGTSSVVIDSTNGVSTVQLPLAGEYGPGETITLLNMIPGATPIAAVAVSQSGADVIVGFAILDPVGPPITLALTYVSNGNNTWTSLPTS